MSRTLTKTAKENRTPAYPYVEDVLEQAEIQGISADDLRLAALGQKELPGDFQKAAEAIYEGYEQYFAEQLDAGNPDYKQYATAYRESVVAGEAPEQINKSFTQQANASFNHDWDEIARQRHSGIRDALDGELLVQGWQLSDKKEQAVARAEGKVQSQTRLADAAALLSQVKGGEEGAEPMQLSAEVEKDAMSAKAKALAGASGAVAAGAGIAAANSWVHRTRSGQESTPGREPEAIKPKGSIKKALVFAAVTAVAVGGVIAAVKMGRHAPSAGSSRG